MAQKTIAIAGLGTIGRKIALWLRDQNDGLKLTAVCSGDAAKATAWLKEQRLAVPVVAAEELPRHAEIIVEAAPASAFAAIVRPALEAGRIVMVLSSSALLVHDDLIALAGARGGRIMVPTGALLGLDAVVAAAEGTIQRVRMVTRKHPRGLDGSPYLKQHGIEMAKIASPTRVFAGSAREAAAGFPANVNVAATLSLAGIGPDRTEVEIWADPGVTRNIHRITVEADAANFTMEIEGVPSENPKTGRLTPLSMIAALKRLTAPLVIGT
ncbi:MAG: aspartate dehydrogenase [Alphaproteobacteria bacterium]|nr:aspartate dehydrogenase [Alphaproteobacteria bacterium]